LIIPLRNAELLKGIRAQLRPELMLATFTGCALLSIAAGVWTRAIGSIEGALAFLKVMVVGQALVLTAAGGLLCLQSIRRDGEACTFDHQRISRLSALELTLGKLFGAPILAYFAALCLAPAAIVGALVSGTGLFALMGAWIPIVFGAVAVHAMALLLSMRMGSGAGPTALLLLVAAAILTTPAVPNLGPVSPLGVAALVGEKPLQAAFFGLRVPHGVMAVLICAGAAIWTLVPVVRNVKRDPSVHELLTPLQASGLSLTVLVVLIGFHGWSEQYAVHAHHDLLAWGAVWAWMLGLAMLHGPEVARRRARRLVEPAGWLEALWPAPALSGALAIAGIVGLVAATLRADKTDWSPWVALFAVVYLALWVARDLVYLQWIRLTNVRRPLLMGVLVLLAFYGFTLAFLYVIAPPAWFSAVLVPTAVGSLASSTWTWLWLLPLLVQAATVAGFAYLRLRQFMAIGVSTGR